MILVSWIGKNDLDAISSSDKGPVLSTLLAKKFEKAYLLYNYPKKAAEPYLEWLNGQCDTETEARHIRLKSPVHYPGIYEAAEAILQELSEDSSAPIAVLLSPGTPAMQVVWILLGKTRFPITFYQSSKEGGVEKINIPFNIAAEYAPELAVRAGKQASVLVEGAIPINAAFDDIRTTAAPMETLKLEATVMAQAGVPVLIYGETGTGKELFARAIHNASGVASGPFVPLNCGGIPSELIESTLFGHVKGAFTGADENRPGVFQQADGGTLFLDEFGELPIAAQVKLLRILQDGEITPVGAKKSGTVDVRIITATNRNLVDEIAEGNFREDLFYRIAVGVVKLPPLRERKGDISFLTDILLEQINEEASGQPNYKHKKISTKAKKVILQHNWPGNVRELRATLVRACLWTPGQDIAEHTIKKAMFNMHRKRGDIFGHSVDESFTVQEVMDEVEEFYVRKAWEESGKRKRQAAELLGYSNYQTLDKRLEKYGIK